MAPVAIKSAVPSAMAGQKTALQLVNFMLRCFYMNNVVEIYNKIAQDYAAIFDEDNSDNSAADTFLQSLPPDGNILDTGCGTGRLTAYYSKQGYQVIGLDASEKMLQIAQHNFPDLDFRLQDIRTVNFSNNSFDAISVAYVLFHVNKIEVAQVVTNITHWLKPGGILFLVLQEGEGEIYVDEPLLSGEKIFLNLYAEAEIVDLLKKNGFLNIKIDRKMPTLAGELPYGKIFIWARN